MNFDDIDWDTWQAKDTATLLFLRRKHPERGTPEVLLIRKKRGLGAGKINAPGGRLEPGETAIQAAVREVEEEVGLLPLDPVWRGELRFQFTDGYALRCHVFTATAWRGTLRETEEALPMWVAEAEIPYAEMWADDALWLPGMLAGGAVGGRFLFGGDRLIGYILET
jgi:8-oxo-dGTP diphosphatase